jgi:hypothetical protein
VVTPTPVRRFGRLAMPALLFSLALSSGALAHYSYRDANLLALSPDGQLGLFAIEEGDTEGGAGGETLLIARLSAGTTPTGLLSILGEQHDTLVAHQQVLPYHPSPGHMMEHSEEERSRAPGLRTRFHSGPAVEQGVTVDVGTVGLPRDASGGFKAPAGVLTVTQTEGRGARLGLGAATAEVADPQGRGLACVEAVYRTDDPSAFVVQIFAWEDGASCPANRSDHFGPPPTRSFSRVVLTEP